MKSYNLLDEFLSHSFTVNGCWKAIKWLYFINLSTITKMMFTLATFDNPNMKSIDISFHTLVSIERGYSNPTELVVSYFIVWHVPYSITYLFISTFIPFQNNMATMRL